MSQAAAALDRTFRALGDPSRLAMIEQLCRGPASVNELARPLAMTLPSVLKHLQVLEDGDLVTSEKAGRVRTYSVRPDVFATLDRWVARRRSAWQRRFDRLERLLADEGGR